MVDSDFELFCTRSLQSCMIWVVYFMFSWISGEMFPLVYGFLCGSGPWGFFLFFFLDSMWDFGRLYTYDIGLLIFYME